MLLTCPYCLKFQIMINWLQGCPPQDPRTRRGTYYVTTFITLRLYLYELLYELCLYELYLWLLYVLLLFTANINVGTYTSIMYIYIYHIRGQSLIYTYTYIHIHGKNILIRDNILYTTTNKCLQCLVNMMYTVF